MESIADKKVTVYLIDDDVDFGKFFVQSISRDRRFISRSFSDYQKGLLALENDQPDLVLIDLHFGEQKNFGFNLSSTGKPPVKTI